MKNFWRTLCQVQRKNALNLQGYAYKITLFLFLDL
nr:MAG TPA: hypothetical protein [Microviridae sp.]